MILRSAPLPLLASVVFASTSFAQSTADTFELKARTGLPNSSFGFDQGALPWVIALVCFVLLGFMLATLWPNEGADNPYQRQRKFARIDGLFLKVAGFVLDDDGSRIAAKDTRNFLRDATLLQTEFEPLTLLSLSFGGCSIASTGKLKKGSVVLLHLHTLPDFPAKALTVAAKVVWTRLEHKDHRGFEVAGAKFIFSSEGESTESLRQYLNYLMDEPVT